MKIKRFSVWILPAVLAFFLTGCGETLAQEASTSAPPEILEPAGPADVISFEGTVFQFNDEAYDITARDQSVNAIMDCTIVSPYVIVEGHIGPKNSYYGIFNTLTQSFEKDIFGGCLTYRDNDINTILYSLWGDIYDYDGNVIASCELEEFSFIREISFIDDNTRIKVEIQDNTSEAPVEMFFDL